MMAVLWAVMMDLLVLRKASGKVVTSVGVTVDRMDATLAAGRVVRWAT